MKLKVIFLYLIIAINIFSNQNFLSLSEIKPGMKGIGYTVVKGVEPEKFDFEIIDIIPGRYSVKKMMLAKFSGEAIQKSGGITEGMSGSPLYIDKKLIGALSYTSESRYNDIGLITPISDMLKLQEFNKESQKQSSETSNHNKESQKFKKGESIMITPVRGDVILENIGTLTYIENNNFFALGHPINKNNMKLFLNKSKINYTIQAQEKPFKIGESLNTIGVVLKDESAGISGIIKEDIPVYKFQIALDKKNEIKKYHFEMPQDIKTLNYYMESALNKLLNQTVPSNDFYCLEYNYNIYNEGDSKVYSNSNFLFSENNLLSNASLNITEDLLHILDNPFDKIDFNNISFNIKLHEDKKLIYLKRATVLEKIIHLGGTLKINLSYLIHQKGIRNEIIEMAIPDDFSVGNTRLEIKAKENKVKDELDFFNQYEYLKFHENNGKNNELIVTLENKNTGRKIEKSVFLDGFIKSKKILTETVIIDSYVADNEE
ncbi:MAG: SpoIVB peptidase S55 domain-containing protein [Fusobacteriota bacterium]